LKTNQFTICFQPQVDFSNNSIISAETLIRWEHPIQGNISPENFIPVAEELGLITLIDKLVFDKICCLLSENTSLGENFIVAFNVLAKDLAQVQFINSLKNIIESHNISPHNLQIELTESAFVNDVENTKHILQDLKLYGFTLALDDFGTGYSCLSHLSDLPIDMLKIDKSFVTDVYKDKKKQVLVRTLVSMAKHLKIKVLAEGVETQEQADFLYKEGCNLMQGYLFSKPVCFEFLLEKVLHSNNRRKKGANT
jgi:EAL domain-containing protein (putative c-di-GMP-specific phosphodiesterase class I)